MIQKKQLQLKFRHGIINMTLEKYIEFNKQLDELTRDSISQLLRSNTSISENAIKLINKKFVQNYGLSTELIDLEKYSKIKYIIKLVYYSTPLQEKQNIILDLYKNLIKILDNQNIVFSPSLTILIKDMIKKQIMDTQLKYTFDEYGLILSSFYDNDVIKYINFDNIIMYPKNIDSLINSIKYNNKYKINNNDSLIYPLLLFLISAMIQNNISENDITFIIFQNIQQNLANLPTDKNNLKCSSLVYDIKQIMQDHPNRIMPDNIITFDNLITNYSFDPQIESLRSSVDHYRYIKLNNPILNDTRKNKMYSEHETIHKCDNNYKIINSSNNKNACHYYFDNNSKFIEYPNLIVHGLQNICSCTSIRNFYDNTEIQIPLSKSKKNEFDKNIKLANHLKIIINDYKNIIKDEKFIKLFNSDTNLSKLLRAKINKIRNRRSGITDGIVPILSEYIFKNRGSKFFSLALSANETYMLSTGHTNISNFYSYNTFVKTANECIDQINNFINMIINNIKEQLKNNHESVYLKLNNNTNQEISEDQIDNDKNIIYNLLEKIDYDISTDNKEILINKVLETYKKEKNKVDNTTIYKIVKFSTENIHEFQNTIEKDFPIIDIKSFDSQFDKCFDFIQIKGMNSHSIGQLYSDTIAFITHYMISENQYSKYFNDNSIISLYGLLSDISILDKYNNENYTIKNQILSGNVFSGHLNLLSIINMDTVKEDTTMTNEHISNFFRFNGDMSHHESIDLLIDKQLLYKKFYLNIKGK